MARLLGVPTFHGIGGGVGFGALRVCEGAYGSLEVEGGPTQNEVTRR